MFPESKEINCDLKHEEIKPQRYESQLDLAPLTTEFVYEGFGSYLAKIEKTDAKTGTIYLKAKNGKFKDYYAVLQDNEIFFYQSSHSTEIKIMHCLTNTFTQESDVEKCPESNHTYFPVKIILHAQKSRLIYLTSDKERQEWVYALRGANCSQDFYKYYEVKQNIGKGQFGEVRLCSHTKSGRDVAVKMVKKRDLKQQEIFQQRKEIEILKMCQHSNVIRLHDYFECSEKYYIVMEYLAGKDLYEYIEKRDFSLKEDRVKELGYQIAKALQYLHSFGIVHRDLKLENIMMDSDSETALVKLVDFGLSKIVGPNETATEAFGTLGYIAPEVLLKKPYSFSVDLWSYGCCIHAAMFGFLPFSSEDDGETV